MMTITNNGMTDITNFIKMDVVYAEYKSGSTWYRIALHDIRVISATKIAIYIMFGVDVPNTISGISGHPPMHSSFLSHPGHALRIFSRKRSNGSLFHASSILLPRSGT